MNAVDVGKFIAFQRKNISLTQKELADKLNVTDKAVSKWETGKCYPDIEIIEKLSEIFDVGINEILSGKIIRPDEQIVESEKNIVDVMKTSEKKQKKWKIISIIFMITIYITVVFPLSMNIWGTPKEKLSYYIGEWNQIADNLEFLPSLSDMGKYSEIKYKHLYRDFIFFESDAYTLTAAYSEENYENQKEIFKNEFVFQENFFEFDSDRYRRTSFDIDNYDFYMASFEEYRMLYPTKILFIGFNDTENEIAFIFYSDMDLDYISTSFEDFLFYDCAWNREESLRRLYYFW